MRRALFCLLLGLTATGACDLNPQPLPPGGPLANVPGGATGEATDAGEGDASLAIGLSSGGGGSSGGGFTSSGGGSNGTGPAAEDSGKEEGSVDANAGALVDAPADAPVVDAGREASELEAGGEDARAEDAEPTD
jgi:hypothetical protein